MIQDWSTDLYDPSVIMNAVTVRVSSFIYHFLLGSVEETT